MRGPQSHFDRGRLPYRLPCVATSPRCSFKEEGTTETGKWGITGPNLDKLEK